jgi:pimeloyl-ACP methyl ester carboxylesterase
MAEDILDITSDQLWVAGHSMGARVAMEIARMAPSRVKRLALLDTGMHPLAKGETEKRREIVAMAHKEGMAALAKRWLPAMVHPNRQTDSVLMDSLTAMVERMNPQLHERQINALITRPDATRYIGQITVPTLLAVGRQDQWSPVPQHEEMLSLMPNATLSVIDHAGHFAPVEQPRAVATLLANWALES